MKNFFKSLLCTFLNFATSLINEIATVNGFRSSLAESLGLLAGRISRGVLARAPLPASDMVNYTVETVFTYGHEKGGGRGRGFVAS